MSGLEKVLKECNGLIFIYNVTVNNSLQNLKWIIEKINNMNIHNSVKILVGNMCDLKDKRIISKKDGKDFAKKYNIEKYFDTSAKTGENVNEAFEFLIKNIIKNIQKENVIIIINIFIYILDKHNFRQKIK